MFMIQEALNAAEAIGDDRLQQQSQDVWSRTALPYLYCSSAIPGLSAGLTAETRRSAIHFAMRLTAAVTDQLLNLTARMAQQGIRRLLVLSGDDAESGAGAAAA